MNDGFGDPHKAQRSGKAHELGHAGQTNTGKLRSLMNADRFPRLQLWARAQY